MVVKKSSDFFQKTLDESTLMCYHIKVLNRPNDFEKGERRLCRKMEKFDHESFQLLFKAMLSLKNEAECAEFLEDLMTRKEMADVAQRLSVAKLLSEQEVYSKIVEKTGASTATISRVNRAYHYGTGAYDKILKRIDGENA